MLAMGTTQVSHETPLPDRWGRDAELAECMTETLHTIELPAMDPGGIIDVRYPFVVGGR